ncbi:hypothetical protein [Roseivirga pacifica]|uniref:hypothetical protein n=1 Tax=Roseivirga pacifica TaxID=1267423 RepID=UPI002094D7EA|nr:hypothetical protein [Roseivirga pacifica]MCO6357246.1 hypothetical protein [Roseivirga pacifica]MCO6368040.1 hypothetical protein [Roseivirga pacifica]MCO6369478.1 hypothetical protein [Roseivirga pacifica]MCO6373332.1 hypothetical protein [Roseivirga pacifica]MCO6377411.1 hypothetical protein [Roseivirga pacifica]
MKGFNNLKILKQGMQLVAAAHQLSDAYAQTDMAGLVKEINLLAIGIPSSIAHYSGTENQKGLGDALEAVVSINAKLETIGLDSAEVANFRQLIEQEHALIQLALAKGGGRSFKKPAKQSRLGLSTKNRKPITFTSSQGFQAELF